MHQCAIISQSYFIMFLLSFAHLDDDERRGTVVSIERMLIETYDILVEKCPQSQRFYPSVESNSLQLLRLLK